MLMVKNKRSKKIRIPQDKSNAVVGSLIWVIIGLMMALGGFVWATYTDKNPEVTGVSAGANLLAVFGLIIASSAVLIMSAVVITTKVKARKRRK